MKKYITLAILTAVIVVAGLAVQHYCFRFPTEGELKRFHEAKQSTRVTSLEVMENENKDLKHFRVQHRSSGFSEFYNVEAPKRWVMPGNDYQWMLKK